MCLQVILFNRLLSVRVHISTLLLFENFEKENKTMIKISKKVLFLTKDRIISFQTNQIMINAEIALRISVNNL